MVYATNKLSNGTLVPWPSKTIEAIQEVEDQVHRDLERPNAWMTPKGKFQEGQIETTPLAAERGNFQEELDLEREALLTEPTQTDYWGLKPGTVCSEMEAPVAKHPFTGRA